MWFSKKSEDVIVELSTNPVEGLSSSEVEKRKAQYGLNKLEGKKGKTLIQLFFAQLNDILIYVLIAAALISGFLGEISDAIIIGIVILINAIVGIVQESKAEKALDALKQLSTPKTIVKRDGQLVEIPSEEVVPGDIIVIDAGRYIPCDIRLVETANLKVEESALTGESVPVDKDADILLDAPDTALGDQKNMAFSSTLATYGRGVGIAVATGMNTEIGKIAKMLNEDEDSKTPLQIKLAELGKTLSIGAIIICAVMFLVGFLQKRNLLDMFMSSISLAVAAIPEGLPAIVTIVLAMGVQRMIKQNAIIRKLPAVETLGSVNIICSDKTGTLTQNKMTVTKFYCNKELKTIDDLNIENSSEKLLIENLVLCNDATSNNGNQTGDPTEVALIDVGNNYNIEKSELNNLHPRVRELPFDSDRKLMSTINKYDDSYYIFTKGATDNLLNLCNKIYINGNILDFNESIKEEILNASYKK